MKYELDLTGSFIQGRPIIGASARSWSRGLYSRRRSDHSWSAAAERSASGSVNGSQKCIIHRRSLSTAAYSAPLNDVKAILCQIAWSIGDWPCCLLYDETGTSNRRNMYECTVDQELTDADWKYYSIVFVTLYIILLLGLRSGMPVINEYWLIDWLIVA